MTVKLCSGEPLVVVPAKILIAMLEESPVALPAEPFAAGVVSLVALPLAGAAMVTAGAAVSTVKVRAGLTSVVDPLKCSAWAV